MSEWNHDNEDLKILLEQYNNLKSGKNNAFLDIESFEKIIEHYDDQEEYSLAIEAAEFAINQYPFSAGLLIKKADLLISRKKFNRALGLLLKAETMDHGDINLYVLKTEAYLGLNMPEKASEIIEIAASQFEGNEQIELLIELSEVFDDYEEFEKVFDCLKLILECDPNNEEALYKICFWTDFTGRNEEGIRLHQQILEANPFNELAWFNLGAAYQGIKLYEKCIDAYKYATAINEHFDYAYRNMGDAYLRLRKYKEAIESLKTVMELSQPEDIIYEALGHCYDKQHQYSQARYYYRKSAQINPDNSQLPFKIACTFMDEEKWAQAIQSLEAALKMHPKQPEYNLALGQCLIELGKYHEAMEYLGIAVKARSRNLGGWLELLRCMYKGGFFEEGVAYISRAFLQTNAKPVLYFYEAAFLFALRKSKEAMIKLEIGLSMNPRLIKKMKELDPAILQNPLIIDALAKCNQKKKL